MELDIDRAFLREHETEWRKQLFGLCAPFKNNRHHGSCCSSEVACSGPVASENHPTFGDPEPSRLVPTVGKTLSVLAAQLCHLAVLSGTGLHFRSPCGPSVKRLGGGQICSCLVLLRINAGCRVAQQSISQSDQNVFNYKSATGAPHAMTSEPARLARRALWSFRNCVIEQTLPSHATGSAGALFGILVVTGLGFMLIL